ncbi:uncharacterized protein [Physcomitrium patens]|uniref:Uncharacterized protein n=1 Tax=Physcomitrium patens TaxID=3218 RepID=A0A2K1JL55_PHYPA|nr:uncharacterized protein LOC112290654 [Physcomitrium patens]XP_024392945.1 uncharacterized protein LOC112290654 [Physcomitrium patens]XP_024392946.1 uncharacterized protein LOC112290654 [Physcomitrium patens]XP_024392947.1 uncharacterized protein LOC112290654 [Physcomitrium patens]XP_024392948.1 uncharacterized protein LOC112290654 [Physcomitrium patens]PNR42257.1 hypothetical protein PHYPA_017086 [Physcomitrium patens]|eukprot:XP_024392943.1 uncharacterized protein LOC112290654 [Physcomitrella patens]
MASLGNITCLRLDNVVRNGEINETSDLLVKGTWLPSEFSISVCDGSLSWIGRADKDFVLNNANKFAMTPSEYVDKIQCCYSKQQPDTRYELKRAANSSLELHCHTESRYELILRLPLTEVSHQTVPIEMIQFLLDAYHYMKEELAKKTRAYEREVAAKELALASLKSQVEEGGTGTAPIGDMNVQLDEKGDGLQNVGRTSSRGKRKAGASAMEVVSRKRASTAVKASDTPPLLQKPASPVIPTDDAPLEKQSSTLALRPHLEALGYTQPTVGEERLNSNKIPIWSDKRETEPIKERSNDDSEDSLSDEAQPKKASHNHRSDAEIAIESKIYLDATPASGKRGSGKKQRKSSGRTVGKSGRKSNKKSQAESLEDSPENQDEDVVETTGKGVENFASTPAKPQRPVPVTAKKTSASKSSSKAKTSAAKSIKKRSKSVSEIEEISSESDDEPEASEVSEVGAKPEEDEDTDRAIAVQSAEFHDFDLTRTESDFEIDHFWALYDDQDGMPRFYARVIDVRRDPFQVKVRWLESFKPNLPANCLVKTAHLSTSCGEFIIGTEILQDLPAFSHKIEVQQEGNNKRSMVKYFPEIEEIWALYRDWDKKHPKKEDDVTEIQYNYDLVQVQSKLSPVEGVDVVPLVKVTGFKSVFTVEDVAKKFNIPYEQLQARFSHRIPEKMLHRSESPGIPVGAFELDPASTPSEYLGSGDPLQ